MKAHKHLTSFSTIVFVTMIFVNTGLSGNHIVEALQSNSTFYSPLVETPVRVEFEQTAERIILNLTVDELTSSQVESATQWRIEGEGIIGQDGKPDLPAICRYVAVPEVGKLSFSYTVNETRRRSASQPVNYRMDEGVDDLTSSSQYTFSLSGDNGLFPSVPVTMSEPMIMRGVRMVALSYYPLQWDETNQEYIENSNVQVEIETHPGRGINEVRRIPRQPSRGFDRLIDRLLVNPPLRDQGHEDYRPGGYLVVADENAPEAVQEFIDWKRHVGHRVDLLTFNGDEVEINVLRNDILDVYEATGFEFLVFMGTDDADPPLYIPMDNRFYDTFYAQLEGDDIFPDVAVGTFNCVTEENFTCAIRRSISYQYTPYMENTEWFMRAGIGVGACSVPNDLSPSYTGKWLTEVLSRTQFDDISTSYFSDNGVDDPSHMIEELYNELPNFILVRAHMWDLDVDVIEASPVYPFQFLCSSGTISPPNNGAFNWMFRQGTPDEMKGPSAGFGHWSSPRTNVANALAGGLAESMFMFDIGSYGWARNYTVGNLARVMVADGLNIMPYYYSHWRYYGDPGQGCWLGVPSEVQELEVDQQISPDATSIRVHTELAEDENVADALVTFSQGEEIRISIHPDENGDVLITWESGALSEESAFVTVTGKNLVSCKFEVEVTPNFDNIALTGYSWNDSDNGNDDGIPNPGETGFIVAEFTNISNNNLQNVSITLGLISSWLEVEEFEPIVMRGLQAGASINVDNIAGTVRDGCPNGEELRVAFQIEHQEPAGQIQAGVVFNAEAPNLSIYNTNGELIINDQTELLIRLLNNGSIDSEQINARLESLVPFVVVTENDRDYSAIGVGERGVQIDENAFILETHENTIPGSVARFQLILEGGGVLDTLHFSLSVGNPEPTDPLGPDSYGYIALSNGDDNVEWADAPVYDWVEIAPWLENEFEGTQIMGEIEDEEDYSELLEIPFPFRYYGEEFDQITVCNNGWIAAGDQSELKNQQNWLLPGFDGAYGMMAVFWDRLHFNRDGDGICYFHDDDGGRFIIEWNGNVEDDRDPGQNAFQIILYDANRFATPTGDSPILYQYRTVSNTQNQWEANTGASVGISSISGLDGLTYTYWNQYPIACSWIEPETAILWTTISYAPLASISGRVDRWIDSTAVRGATVSTSNGFQTTTSRDGSYRIVGFEPGEFELTVIADRYGEIVIEGLVAEEGEAIEQDVILPHAWLITSFDSLEYWGGFKRGPTQELFVIAGLGEGRSTFNMDVDFDGSGLDPEIMYWEFHPEEGDINSGDTLEVWFSLDFNGNPYGDHYFDILIEVDTPQEVVILPVHIDILSVDDESLVPYMYKLAEPYPNPFNSSVNVSFEVPVKSRTSIVLYDISGKRIRTLASGQFSAGSHTITMQGDDLSTGIYFLRMEAGEFVSTRRLLLLR